ncbi:MAG: hypothetical protein ACFFAH_14650 [Promethearchaeota archaeon]
MIVLIFIILYEIFVITFLLIDPSMVAVRVELMNSDPSLYVTIISLIILINAIITYTLFFRDTLRSVEQKIRLKGKFVYSGAILYIVSRIIDVIVPLDLVMLFLTRSLITISSIITYIGWVMPDRIAKWFIKEKQ